MSCRVLKAGDSPADSTLIWRQVRADAGATAGAPDIAARLAETEKLAETRAKEAYEKGRIEGEAEGRRRGAAEIQAAVERLARTVEELSGVRARLRSEAERDVVQLALLIARRILRREMAVDPDALHGLITAALEKLQAQEITRVRVHPSHAATLTACLRNSPSKMDIVPEPKLEPGALIFETERGNLDASVDSQLKEIERGLTDRMRRRA